MSASPTEILERAADIRSRTTGEQHTYSAEESLVLFQADCIANSRRDSGISSIIKALIPSFKTEREQAQEALEKARQREAQAEQLAGNIAGLKKRLDQEMATRKRLIDLADSITKKPNPFKNAFWSRSEHNVEGHLRLAARTMLEDQMVAAQMPLLIDLCNVEIATIKDEIGTAEKALSKL